MSKMSNTGISGHDKYYRSSWKIEFNPGQQVCGGELEVKQVDIGRSQRWELLTHCLTSESISWNRKTSINPTE